MSRGSSPDSGGGRRGRARPWRVLGLFGLALSWGLCVPSAMGAAALVAVSGLAAPTTPDGLRWVIDLAANLAAQMCVIAAIGAAAAFVFRRWAAGLLGLVALLVLVVGLLGVPRAPVDADADGPRVRVMVYNALSDSRSSSAQAELLLASNADVIALIEPSSGLLELIRADSPLRTAYPYFRLPDRAGPGFRFVLSRHPLLRDEDGFGILWPELKETFGYHGTRVLRVETEAGPFVFISAQLRSPRSAERWAAGNQQASDAAAGIEKLRESVALPVIVAGDFNASPTGWRLRELASRTGLVHAKPALRATGTYPAWSVWPAQTAIDGVLVSQGVRTVSWGVAGPAGSDHLAVVTELALPGVGD